MVWACRVLLTTLLTVQLFVGDAVSQTLRFSWQDEMEEDAADREAARGNPACAGRLTDKSAEEIIDCIDGTNFNRGIIERDTGDCDEVAEAIRKIGWLSNPDRLPHQSLDPGWPYPAPNCDVAMAVQRVFSDRFRTTEEGFRQQYAAEQRERDAQNERLLQRWIDGIQSRADADMARISSSGTNAARVAGTSNGIPGNIGEPEIDTALIALFQGNVSDDRLLLDRGFRLFSPVFGLYGSVTLAGVSDIICEATSLSHVECTLRADTDRQIDMTRLYGTSEQGQAWANLARATTPTSYSTNMQLAFVHDGTGWWVERIARDEMSLMIEGPLIDTTGNRAPCVAFSAMDILLNC